MSTMRRATAWLNLAYRFGRHVLRMPTRLVRNGSDAARFLDAVIPEGYVPLTPEERDIVPAAMRCVHCGLCAFTTPATEQAASAWDEAWTFVAGPSRSIDRSVLAAPQADALAGCDDCAAVCPAGVPIPQLARLVLRTRTDLHPTQDT